MEEVNGDIDSVCDGRKYHLVFPFLMETIVGCIDELENKDGFDWHGDGDIGYVVFVGTWSFLGGYGWCMH